MTTETATPRLIVSGNGWRSKHLYQVGDEGPTYPSVTAILKAINKPALVGWAAKAAAEFAVTQRNQVFAIAEADPTAAVDLVKGAPWRDRDKAASLGSRVHKMIETGATPDDEEAPFVDAYAAWLEATPGEVLHQEVAVVSTVGGYGGTLDLIFRHKDGRHLLIDVKTGRTAADRDGVPYLESRLQGAAYALCDVGLPVPIDATGVLHVRPSGAVPYVAAADRDEIDRLGVVFAAVKVLADEMGLTEVAA